jgi:uncharacterized protein (DUF1501 family)
MRRRDFIRYSLAATGAFGLNLYSIPVFAQQARREKLIYIFLRGGADFLSLFPPKLNRPASVGAVAVEWRNHPLYPYRGVNDNMCKSFLFGSSAFPVGDYEAGSPNAPLEFPDYPVDFHPGFKAMLPVLQTQNLAVILHTGPKNNSSRSHFDQQDMIESGSETYKYSTGYLARALSLSNGRKAVAIGATLPKSLVGADVSLLNSAQDAKGPESVAGSRVFAALYEDAEKTTLRSGMDLKDRLDYFRDRSDLNCESGGLCKSAKDAQSMYAQLATDLRDYSSTAISEFAKACSLAAQLTNGNFNPAIMTIDYPGWDHHFGENPKVETSALYTKVKGLAEGLNELYLRMSEDTVVVVMSEFGRTVVGNQSLGTDHGRGGAMMVMGKRVDRSRITNVPPEWNLRPESFDGTAGSRALKVDIDSREIMAELLDRHLRLPQVQGTPSPFLQAITPLQDRNINKVFDGLTSYRRRNLV